MRRLDRAWWAVPGVVILGLLILIFRPELRSLFGGGEPAPVESAAPEPPPPPPPAPKPSSAPSATAAPKPVPAAPAAPRPTVVDGKDADAWRVILRGALMRGDAKVALDALAALSAIDPSRFEDRKVLSDAATAAHLAAATNEDLGQKLFELIASPEFGQAGPDVLYRVMSLHGGSAAAKRAAELLTKPEIIERGTPALRIAIALRDAPCTERPALFDRAAKEGDERTLYILTAMRGGGCGATGCCMRANTKLDQTILAVRERTR